MVKQMNTKHSQKNRNRDEIFPLVEQHTWKSKAERKPKPKITVNIILNHERLSHSPKDQEKSFSVSPLSFNIVWEVLANVIR